MKSDEKTLWNHKYGERSHSSLEPDPFLVSAYAEFIGTGKSGTALDVAGGAGRHSLWLAERGWQVKLVDISEVGVELAKKNLAGLGPASTFEIEVRDLQARRNLGRRQYDLILVFFYLQRSLFPALTSALKPGGSLVYKTYTVEQRRFRGGPSHPLHLLKPNELLRAFPSLRILYYRETIHERGVAELVARKRSAPRS